MRKEVGYCNYYNKEFVEKYNGLTYFAYVTRIEGNTFYLECDRTKYASFGREYNLAERIIIKHSNQRNGVLCIIPMIKTAEETIRDVLRSWNFGCKYEWLNDDLEDSLCGVYEKTNSPSITQYTAKKSKSTSVMRMGI